MDDVQHAIGQSGLFEQLRHPDARRRILFRWLEDEGVSTGERHRKHPHWHHRGKVERCDARADPQGLQSRVRVDLAANRFGVLALEQVRRADGELDDFDAALHRAHRVEKHLAVLLADERRDLFLMQLHQLAKARENAGAAQGRRRPPGRERGHGGLHRIIDIVRVRKGNRPNNLTGRRVGHLTEATAGRSDFLSVNPQRHPHRGRRRSGGCNTQRRHGANVPRQAP